MGPRDQSGRQSGMGPRDQSGRGSGRMSGRGSGMMSGRGSGMMSGRGREKMMKQYCGPQLEREIETGLQVTVTYYTDDQCTEMLEFGRRRLQGRRNKNEGD